MDECPFCGEAHPPGPVGEPGSMFEGIEFKTCPNMPSGTVYEDVEFNSGPRGRLHHLGDAPEG